jgi:hypothetical protein
MQERGDPDSDENEEFIAGMTPDDMRVGPPVFAPLNVGNAARRAHDEPARDELRDELHGVEQMSIGTNSPPQLVPLGAPCPGTK